MNFPLFNYSCKIECDQVDTTTDKTTFNKNLFFFKCVKSFVSQYLRELL